MIGPQFFETRMGRAFYEHTVPELVRQPDRLNENIERSQEVAEQPMTPVQGDEHDRDEEKNTPNDRPAQAPGRLSR